MIAALFGSIWLFFSPNGGCEKQIVTEIGKARSTVLVEAYLLTDGPIIVALEQQSRRCKVGVILDKGQYAVSSKAMGNYYWMGSSVAIQTLVDGKHAIFHDKVIIIDSKTVITGSFNFTANAEHNNAENLLIIHDARLAAKYTANWQLHAAHSVSP